MPSLKLFAGSVLMTCLLVGCGALPQPPQAVVRYDLGAAPTPSALQEGIAAIALAPMQAPLQTEGSTAVHYRLSYANAQVLHAYTQARWSQPPATLVLQRVREHLGQGGRVVLSAEPGELPPSVQGRQVPVLRLALEEFSQVFASAQDSSAWVRVRATLVDPAPQGDVLLAQQLFEVRHPAAQANAEAGVQALSRSVDGLGQQINRWLQSALLRSVGSDKR